MRNQAAVPAVSSQFFFNECQVRVVMVNNEPWFVAKDVCDVLGLSNTTRALLKIPSKHFTLNPIKGKRGMHDVNTIDEAGLYRLVLRSDKPNAEPFIEWVTTEVIPTIRKTGEYKVKERPTTAMQEACAMLQDPAKMRELLGYYAEKTIQLETKIEADEPLVKFAQQIQESTDTITVGQLAKFLCKRGYEIGQNRLFRFLRNHNILMLNNEPYQRYLNQGWFETREYTMTTSRGTLVKSQTIVTGKGQLAIAELIRKEQVRLTAPIANVQRRLAA